MALSKSQQAAIDQLIFKNKKAIDIIDELVRTHGATARDVSEYLQENKTLQGMLKTITHRTKDVAKAGDEATRTKAAKEIEALSKKAIKVLQQRDDNSL
jgi:3-methyladenine DNA glycosylase AlkC